MSEFRNITTRYESDKKKVVIVGGGFGELQAMKTLAIVAADGTLVDRVNHHWFQPLRYQVETSGLDSVGIASPLCSLFGKTRNVWMRRETVTGFNPNARVAYLQTGDELPFDFRIPAPSLSAKAQGRYAARRILLSLSGTSSKPFRYRDRGKPAAIGRGTAVGQSGKARFSERLARLLRLFVHLLYIAGFENRPLVFIRWGVSCIQQTRGARGIVGSEFIPVSHKERPQPVATEKRSRNVVD